MKKIIAILFTFVSVITLASERPDHSILDRFLQSYVSSTGRVNYKAMKPKVDTLNKYLLELNEHSPASDWSKNERKAYYMNAYNAYTLKFVLTKYPVKSVKDISFSGKDVWNTRLVKLGGKAYTLTQVENDILRKMGDARIHFGINCASYSCPRLWNHAFTAQNVNSQLTKLTKAYINNTKHNTLTEKKVAVAKIFEWYNEDFVKNGQSLIDYLNKYSKITISEKAKVEYLPYNWSLNE